MIDVTDISDWSNTMKYNENRTLRLSVYWAKIKTLIVNTS